MRDNEELRTLIWMSKQCPRVYTPTVFRQKYTHPGHQGADLQRRCGLLRTLSVPCLEQLLRPIASDSYRLRLKSSLPNYASILLTHRLVVRAQRRQG